VHPPPRVDSGTLKLFRRRLAWGLLGLAQPPEDLPLALQDFAERWGGNQPTPAPLPWQAQLLSAWRSQPRALRSAPTDPVVETMVACLALEDDTSLNDFFQPALLRLAREGVASFEELKPTLRYAWGQISLAMQRLRPGLGSYSHEAEGALSKILMAMQHVNDYGRVHSLASLQEAGWRWAEAMDEWDRLAAMILTGMQPVSSPLLWSVLIGNLQCDTQGALGALSDWFAGWAMDLAHVVAPYLTDFVHPRNQDLCAALETFGLALMAWQKVLPGWERELMIEWNAFREALPTVPQTRTGRAAGFRWLAPQRSPEQESLEHGLWRQWLGGSAEAGHTLQRALPLARLVVLLAEPSFRACSEPFPEADIVHSSGLWLRGRASEEARSAVRSLEELVVPARA
jgi:hypothetical protein